MSEVFLYEVKCDDCKALIGNTNDALVSAAGGSCPECKRSMAEEARWEADRDERAMDDLTEGAASQADPMED